MNTVSPRRSAPVRPKVASLHYRLECLDRGTLHEEHSRGFALANPDAAAPALLRASYDEKRFLVHADEPGIFRFRSWLPVRRSFPGAGAPAAFRAEALARHLGMRELVPVFSGYWPERGADLRSCTFKELEALSVLARIPETEERTLVVASAGNTGRAFYQAASRYGCRVVVVVPERALGSIWSTAPRSRDVRLVALRGEADYSDAIALADTIAALPGYYPEGGARNVARRDGMGTTLLAAAELLGDCPAHYVQAVGSGTGGIGAWEMSLRLLSSGFASRLARLHLVQNEPFTPMTDAWLSGSRTLLPMEHADALRRIDALHSPVLSNRKPPYSITGGVYDALCDTGGTMSAVSSEAAREAGELFERLEGCDLDPAAEVALAGLMEGLRKGTIPRGEPVALNLTGGGFRRLREVSEVREVAADVTFESDELTPEAAARKLE